MSAAAAAIRDRLQAVEDERQRRAAAPELQARVVALKAFQQRRFAHTYADLLLSARYGAAARYFLEELYGPKDFTSRDQQFGRIAPAIVRVFPAGLAETIVTLAELHALSEALDTSMAMALGDTSIDRADYVVAWQDVGRSPDRERQIALTLAIAAQLDRLTRLPMLRNSLRLMRTPARAAGFADLHRTLEAGFDTFRAMKGAQEFIDIIGERERAFATALFAARSGAADDDAAMARALAQLPVR